jgi:HEAT repeat protein
VAVRAGYTGDEVAARDLQTDGDPATRASAVAALVRMGVATAHDLVGALGDDDPSVRQRALRLLIGLDPGLGFDLEPHLLAHLPDLDDGVTEVAAFVAGEVLGSSGMHSSALVTALSSIAVGHEDALCRESAVAALGAIGDVDGLPAVLAGCDDRATVRRRAVLALAAFEGPEVEATLARLATDRDIQVRQAAEDLA